MFKRFPATRWLALTSLGATAIVLAVLATPRFSSAQQSGDAVYLRGSQQVQQDRVQLLNEEFRERQHERAEALERARRAAHGKHSRGVKAVQAPGDDDRYVGASAAMKMAKEFGL